MRRLPCPLLLCCLLLAGQAGAAPPVPQQQPQQQPPSACAKALQEQQQVQQQPQKKVDPDALYDPCRLSDGNPNHDIGNNEGESPPDLYDKLDEWVEWNRRLADNNEAALRLWSNGEDVAVMPRGTAHGDEEWSYWRLSERYNSGHSQPWLAPAGAAPAVPEPASVGSLAAGLTLLAALQRRRRQAINAGKARPAARQ
ncbi:PEP-CTERM sorting domain-containing protein [Duganella sp.]|uniref:PEP-CTERM sorting domain-containing protein n=1 Tax=Duganella sp. TaxID=1904440 RepID=UPI0031E47A1A